MEIEILWNDLIYRRFLNQVKIDEQKLKNRIKKLGDQQSKEYFLSEIVFEKKKDINLKNLVNQITSSISEIGFNNAANIYSISESSKFGGKIGWVDEKNLSDPINDKIKKINVGEFTEIINIGKNYLILKVEEIKLKKKKINQKKELEKMIQFETNKQLNQFSRIYFDKVRMNYSINEN